MHACHITHSVHVTFVMGTGRQKLSAYLHCPYLHTITDTWYLILTLSSKTHDLPFLQVITACTAPPSLLVPLTSALQCWGEGWWSWCGRRRLLLLLVVWAWAWLEPGDGLVVPSCYPQTGRPPQTPRPCTRQSRPRRRHTC